jgi:hypothetical protein
MFSHMPTDLTLHIGTPKSGTTYLQATLTAGRRALDRAGILYPGERYLPGNGFNQQPAMYALGRRHIGWVNDKAIASAIRHFGRLCEEVSVHRGRVLISAESLAFFDISEIDTLLDKLGTERPRASVVITARDLGRILPSIWQQNVKNGATQPLNAYLDSVAELRGTPDVPMWTAFGLPGLVERWASVVGLDHVTLVTASHHGQAQLWRRFAEAALVPQRLPETTGTGTTFDRNTSLSWSQIEVLRHLNAMLQSEKHDPRRAQVTRERLLRIWMDGSSGSGPRIGLPAHLQPVVTRWADEDIDRLAACGVRVVGSLDDLRPTKPSGPGFDSPVVNLEDVARDVLQLLEHRTPTGQVRDDARGLLHRLRHIPLPRRRRVTPPAPPTSRTLPGDVVIDATSVDITAYEPKGVPQP